MLVKKLFIVIPTVMILFLAGCQAEQQNYKSAQNNQNLLPTTQTADQETAISTRSYSAADQAAYDGAQQLKDTSFCDKISDENYKKTCKDAISDQQYLGEARAKIDTALCARLSTKDKQKACNIQIEVLLKEQENIKKQEESRKNTGTLRDQFVKAGDYKRCQELKIEGYISECEVNILSQKAISTKDINWCKKASAKSSQEQCEEIARKILGKK